MEFYQRITTSFLALIAGILAFFGSCYFLLIAKFNLSDIFYRIISASFTMLFFIGIVLIIASIITILYSIFKEYGE